MLKRPQYTSGSAHRRSAHKRAQRISGLPHKRAQHIGASAHTLVEITISGSKSSRNLLAHSASSTNCFTPTIWRGLSLTPKISTPPSALENAASVLEYSEKSFPTKSRLNSRCLPSRVVYGERFRIELNQLCDVYVHSSTAFHGPVVTRNGLLG
jgi:hypothetical protein